MFALGFETFCFFSIPSCVNLYVQIFLKDVYHDIFGMDEELQTI